MGESGQAFGELVVELPFPPPKKLLFPFEFDRDDWPEPSVKRDNKTLGELPLLVVP